MKGGKYLGLQVVSFIERLLKLCPYIDQRFSCIAASNDQIWSGPYCIRFNLYGVKLLWILAFSDFHVFIFTDGHVVPLHKSPI